MSSGTTRGSVILSRDVSRLLVKPSEENAGKHLDLVNNDILKIITDPYDVPDVSAVSLAVVMEDLADQLDVLGRSVGGPEVELRSKPSVELDLATHRGRPQIPGIDETEHDIEDEDLQCERYLLKQHYESVLPRRQRQAVEGPCTTYTRRLSQAIRGSYLSTLTDSGKLQVDRAYLQKAVQDVMIDIIQRSSFCSLAKCIETEAANKAERWRLAIADKNHAVLTKKMKHDIKMAKKEKIVESKRYERLIWGLEDNTQELLARTRMEHAYMKHTGEMVATRSAKKCKKIEDEVELQLEDKKTDFKNEYHVHTSMMTSLRKKYEELLVLQDYWMDKYEVDKDALQADLDAMKANREKDLQRISWLKFIIGNYSQIVMDERRIKAIAEARRTRTELEIKRAIKCQAWWRGTMVRRKLGEYSLARIKAAQKAEAERILALIAKRKAQKEKEKEKNKRK